MKINKIWKVLARMIHYGKKAVHGAQRNSKKVTTRKASKRLYLLTHLGDMRQLRKLKKRIYKSRVIKGISQKK